MKRKNAFLLLCLLLASSLVACHKDLPADTPLDPETPTAPTAPVQPVTPTVLHIRRANYIIAGVQSSSLDEATKAH